MRVYLGAGSVLSRTIPRVTHSKPGRRSSLGRGRVMSVYVDQLGPQTLSLWHSRVKSCHMFADTLSELLGMAQCLDLQRGWLHYSHKPPGVPHFDIVGSKRTLAVEAGAIELDRRAASALIKRLRKDGVPATRAEQPLGKER